MQDLELQLLKVQEEHRRANDEVCSRKLFVFISRLLPWNLLMTYAFIVSQQSFSQPLTDASQIVSQAPFVNLKLRCAGDLQL